MKYIVNGYWIYLQYWSCLRIDELTRKSMPKCWEHIDDFNIITVAILEVLKYCTYRCIIEQSSGYIISYSWFVIKGKYLYLQNLKSCWWIQREFWIKEEIIIKSLWFWSKWQDYKLWLRYKGFVEIILTNKYLEHFNMLMCVINHNCWILCNTKPSHSGSVLLHKSHYSEAKGFSNTSSPSLELSISSLEETWIVLIV